MSTFTPEQIKIAESNGVSLAALHNRIKRGWNIESAINTPLLNGNQSAKVGAKAAREYAKRKRSTSWFANGANSLIRCPYPGCTHTGTVITKAHCKLAHNMDRKELAKKYGMPYQIVLDSDKLSENMKGVRRI